MAKKKNDAYYLQLLQNAIAAANQPSQYEQSANTDYTNLRNFLTPTGRAPDFRDPIAAGVVTGMLPLEEYHKQRRQLRGMPQNGKRDGRPMGVRNAPVDDLASRQTQLADNQFDADYGNAYQDALGNLGGVNQNQQMNLMDMYNSRTGLGIQGSLAGLQAITNKQPSSLSQWLPGALSAGANGLLGYLNNRGSRFPGGTVAVPPPPRS